MAFVKSHIAIHQQVVTERERERERESHLSVVSIVLHDPLNLHLKWSLPGQHNLNFDSSLKVGELAKCIQCTCKSRGSKELTPDEAACGWSWKIEVDFNKKGGKKPGYVTRERIEVSQLLSCNYLFESSILWTKWNKWVSDTHKSPFCNVVFAINDGASLIIHITHLASVPIVYAISAKIIALQNLSLSMSLQEIGCFFCHICAYKLLQCITLLL